MAFGFETEATGNGCASAFSTIVPNCVFFIEEMSLSNDLFVTNVNYTSLLAAGSGRSGPDPDQIITDPLLNNINSVTWDSIEFE